MIAFLVVICFQLTVEAAPLSLQDQLQVALQQIAELKGNDSCCNVSLVYPQLVYCCFVTNHSFVTVDKPDHSGCVQD